MLVIINTSVFNIIRISEFIKITSVSIHIINDKQIENSTYIGSGVLTLITVLYLVFKAFGLL